MNGKKLPPFDKIGFGNLTSKKEVGAESNCKRILHKMR
jgi:hypothetical protein